jgi:hypothetical protein
MRKGATELLSLLPTPPPHRPHGTLLPCHTPPSVDTMVCCPLPHLLSRLVHNLVIPLESCTSCWPPSLDSAVCMDPLAGIQSRHSRRMCECGVDDRLHVPWVSAPLPCARNCTGSKCAVEGLRSTRGTTFGTRECLCLLPVLPGGLGVLPGS